MGGDAVTLSLCGDVMPGRGVDQILPHPGDPALREPAVRDARTYVELAEAVNGPIPRPVDFAWPWGDALAVLDDAAPDARLVNLETSVTRSGEFAAGKAVHYRMHPANLPCLVAAGVDVCSLANNHVLDFGRAGLAETCATLTDAGLRPVGAGCDAARARSPGIVPVEHGGRVVVFSCGVPSSGIPPSWAATAERSGLDVTPELSDRIAAEITGRVRAVKRPGDVAVVSIHWGSNWGYQICQEQIRFAHHLVDHGVDVVYGHSSHHPRPIEVYRNRLVLYGCGDFIDDYEGITGYEDFRPDLRLLYLASVDAGTGELLELRMVPLRARRMRLHHAGLADAAWLQTVLNRVSRTFGAHIDLTSDGGLTLSGW